MTVFTQSNRKVEYVGVSNLITSLITLVRRQWHVLKLLILVGLYPDKFTVKLFSLIPLLDEYVFMQESSFVYKF